MVDRTEIPSGFLEGVGDRHSLANVQAIGARLDAVHLRDRLRDVTRVRQIEERDV